MKSTALSRLGQRIEEPPISWLMKMTLENPRLVSLAAGFTDNPTLPTRAAALALQNLLRQPKRGQNALQYGSTQGDPVLRQLAVQRMQTLDNPISQVALPNIYDSSRLLISNGSQQLLYMITEALCDPGDVILVEDPTYFVYLGIAQSHGLDCRGVKLLEDGLDLDALDGALAKLKRKSLLSRLKFLYLVSYFQNPTGTTTSFAKKTAALELLRSYEKHAGHPIYLLEDAAYRELRFAGEDIPSALASLTDRVIYVGTFSKPFAAGARVGYGLMPPELSSIVQRIKGNHDFGTANLLQQFMVEIINNGDYSKHLEQLGRRYAKKAGIMARAMEAWFPEEVEWRRPHGGLYFWAKMPGGMATDPKSDLFQQALRKDVLYVPGEFCYAVDPTRSKPNTEMRLSFGGAKLQDIPIGIERLGKVIRKQMRR